MELRGSNLSIGSCPEAVNTPGRTRILEARSKPLLGQPPAFSQIETPCAVSLGNYSTTLKLQMARAMVAVPKRAMRIPSCGWGFAHHTPSGVGAIYSITHKSARIILHRNECEMSGPGWSSSTRHWKREWSITHCRCPPRAKPAGRLEFCLL